MNERHWITEYVGRETLELLSSGLAGSELHSVLLEVARRRALARDAADVLAQYRNDALCRPAALDQRASTAMDARLFEAAERYEAIELSPVAPLGTCSTVALTDQHRVLSTLRTSEVVSDPTNVLALECALRLRANPTARVHLATSQRVVRAQPVPNVPGYAPHFRIFVLASGGAEAKDHAFTVDTVVDQVRTFQRALDRLEQQGYVFGRRRFDVLATPARAALGDRIADALGDRSSRKLLEHPYYSAGLRVIQWVTAPDGAEIPLVDGGTFDWLAKLTSNRRAVFTASGGGTQLIGLRFRLQAEGA